MSQSMKHQTHPGLDEKQCVACRQTIDAKATRCPHCQAWQSKWHGPAGQRRMALFVALPLVIVIFGGEFLFFWWLLHEEDFEEHRAQVTLVDMKMDFDNSSVVVLGAIKNESQVGWEDFHLEARFRDARGNIIDAITEELYSLRVPPAQTVSFKIDTIRAVEDKTRYHTFDVRIIDADEVGRF